MSFDIYQTVTDRLVTALEAGTVPWLRPWKTANRGSALEPYNASSGRPYNGVNLLILGCAPYQSLGWMTFNQARALGGCVRKGERGTTVVFWKFDRVRDDETGEVKTRPFARAYTVFNVEQIDGLPETLAAPLPPVAPEGGVIEVARRHGVDLRHGGDRAFFSPTYDFVQMPSADAFKSPEHYDATLAHELTHWTGGKARLDREFGKRFGDQAYAFEELIAEIGSAFACARLGVPLDGLQHPAYLANWLAVLKGDKRAIFTAASAAKRAAELLLGAAGEGEADGDPGEAHGELADALAA